jgi:hypothetical protein
MRSKLLLVLTLAFPFFFAANTFASNLINNGGFETGDFNGWTTGGFFVDTMVVSGPFYAYSGAAEGTFYAVLGPDNVDATLSQTFADTRGGSYVFSFYFAAADDPLSEILAAWDGTILYDVVNPTTGGTWDLLSFNVTGTGSDTIQFTFRDDPGYMALDGVSVVPAGNSSTPEPGSFVLLATGIAALGGTLRRKSRAIR